MPAAIHRSTQLARRRVGTTLARYHDDIETWQYPLVPTEALAHGTPDAVTHDRVRYCPARSRDAETRIIPRVWPS
jgi:hypothetical protein